MPRSLPCPEVLDEVLDEVLPAAGRLLPAASRLAEKGCWLAIDGAKTLACWVHLAAVSQTRLAPPRCGRPSQAEAGRLVLYGSTGHPVDSGLLIFR